MSDFNLARTLENTDFDWREALESSRARSAHEGFDVDIIVSTPPPYDAPKSWEFNGFYFRRIRQGSERLGTYVPPPILSINSSVGHPYIIISPSEALAVPTVEQRSMMLERGLYVRQAPAPIFEQFIANVGIVAAERSELHNGKFGSLEDLRWKLAH